MSAPIEVWRDHLGDWAAACDEHDHEVFTPDWPTAYEAALGHACMHHPKEAV